MPLNHEAGSAHARDSLKFGPGSFRPVLVLFASVGAALVYAAWITWRFRGGNLDNQYLYVVPIVVPFVAFLIERAAQLKHRRHGLLVVDFLVVGTSMMRVIGDVPFVSGHTLFLTYAILSSRSWVTRITASLVFLETVYLKYLVWHDPITSSTGIVLGTIAALGARRLNRPRPMSPAAKTSEE